MPGKITELAALTGAQIALTDLIEMVDVSNTSMAATGTNVRVAQSEYLTFLATQGIGGVTDGDKGDIVVSGGGSTWTIDAGAVTAAKVAADVATQAELDAAIATRQPIDTDLTAIAALTATTDNVIQSSGSAWASRTPAQLKTSLALTKSDVGLANVDNTTDAAKPVSTATTTALGLKADKTTTVTGTGALNGGGDLSANRTLDVASGGITNAKLANAPANTLKGNNTGVSAVPLDLTVAQTKTLLAYTKSDVGLANVDNTSDAAKPVSTAQQTALDAKADAAATTTALNNKQPLDADLTTIAGLTATTDNFMIGAASAWASRTPAQAKTSLALTKTDVGLANVDNTTDTSKPISSATQTALNAKLDTSTATSTYQPLDSDLTTIAGLTATADNFIGSSGSAWAARTPAQVKTSLALANVDNTSDANKPVSTATQTALNAKANSAITVTGTGALNGGGDLTVNRTLDVANDGITNVKLANAPANTLKGNNTGTAADPLDLTVAQVKTLLAYVKGDVGLGNVDNTSDANKPVSTAQQTALDAKADAATTTSALAGKQPLDTDLTVIAGLAQANGSVIQSNGTAWTAATPATLKTSLSLTKTDVGLSNVDNTTDAAKPVSTATQTALNAKLDTTTAASTYQPLDTDLTTIAGLAATTNNVIQSVGSAWASRTPAQLKTSLSLTSADVGLGSVDNTTDAAKPVSTATQTSLDAKADKTTTVTGTGALSGGGDLSANRTLDVANDGITNAKLANVPSPSFKGRSALGTGDPEDLLPSQVAAYLPDFAPSYAKGVVTGPATATGKYLKDDGTWGAVAALAQPVQTQSGTTYSIVAADSGKLTRLTATATITLPSGALATGERVDFVCVGGPATFALGSGASWDVSPTPSAVARATGSFITAVKMGATTWALTGD